MSSVVVFPEVQLLGSDFIFLLLSHILLYSVAIYSDSTYERDDAQHHVPVTGRIKNTPVLFPDILDHTPDKTSNSPI